ncbi:hypothetical protein GKE62_13610 [Novosphingobium sp. Gsoil 351]|nr:hypothetical protein GKE62_13610 [Novosphingobium sp. Gsoil 351]
MGAGQAVAGAAATVREFRQILIWPLQLAPLYGTPGPPTHWERLAASDSPWEVVRNEFADDPGDFQERHYCEFVAFMPDVQRFLYGERMGTAADGREPAALRVFRRRDVTHAAVTLRRGENPLRLEVARAELYFFYDIDEAILAIEVVGRDLTLPQAQQLLFRFGRAYPKGWNVGGDGAHCCAAVNLLAADGSILARSDYERKGEYLTHVCAHRAPRLAAHWAFLLDPLIPHHGAKPGGIRYILLDHQRIPLLAYLAVDDPFAIAREDWVRLGLAAAPDTPYTSEFFDDFEKRHCYDRFWSGARRDQQTVTRIICTGQTFVMVGEASSRTYTDLDTGILAQFRHQYFLIALIAHFHRAALLVFRDGLVGAIGGLRDYSAETVKRFKRAIRLTHENFLRFTHRYWFQEVSAQPVAQELFMLWLAHLGTEHLFAEVREEVQDMMDYLDSDGLRRQANTVVRLTVVTFFGLIGTVATGFLGMNLIDLTRVSLLEKAGYLMAVLVPAAVLTFYTAAKSQRLAEFLEAMSDERRNARVKWQAFKRVWEK